MPRVPPFDRRATYEDLLQLPDNVVGEIIDGELHATATPARRLAGGATALGGMLLRGLARDRGAASWQILPGAELHLGPDVLVPILAGWRTSRLPELPATAYFSVPPDWVCEILSTYSASLRARKMAIYAGEGVSHAWVLDQVARTVEVRRLQDGRWIELATHVGDEMVHAEPFETLEIALGALWPRDQADGRTRRR